LTSPSRDVTSDSRGRNGILSSGTLRSQRAREFHCRECIVSFWNSKTNDANSSSDPHGSSPSP
jgi:hypothetical protein